MSADIYIITNKGLISQEEALDECVAGQSMKEYYNNSQKVYLEHYLKAKENLFFLYSTDFFLSVLSMTSLSSPFLQTFFQFVLDNKRLCKGNNGE